MAALKKAGWYILDRWLPTYSMEVPFFLDDGLQAAAAE
jgi:hypothetical protein